MVCLLLHNIHTIWRKWKNYIGIEMPTRQHSHRGKTWQQNVGFIIIWNSDTIGNPTAMSYITLLYATSSSNNLPPLAPFHVHSRGQPHQQNILPPVTTTPPLNVHSSRASHGQFFCIMTSAFKFSKPSLDCHKLQRTSTMENICSVSIWDLKLQEFA